MMKLLTFMILAILASCGEDVGSNHKIATAGRKPEVNVPELTATNSIILSQLHREKGSEILTYSQEITGIINNALPDRLYRVIPSMEKDDEGSIVNVTTMNDIGRPSIDCGAGTNFTGINARIADCAEKNGDRAIWNGHRFGAAGEGNWKLVAKTEMNEHWMDERTGLVWSYLLNPVNWCRASGNTQNNSPFNDIDCGTIGGMESICVGAILESIPEGQIKWRLPTRNDFLQADINGLRFVLPQETSSGLWTATIRASSQGRSEAWVYHSTNGTLSSANLATERQVRCVGAPKL